MRPYFVPLIGFLLSLLLPGLVANTQTAIGITAIGPQPEPPEIFNANIQAVVVNHGGPCKEDVHLTGNVHLVTDIRRVNRVVEIAVFITLVDVYGEGVLTGAQYVATGAARKDVVTQALPANIPIQATFAFVPLGACQLPSPQEEHLTVQFELAFDAAGGLVTTLLPVSGIDVMLTD